MGEENELEKRAIEELLRETDRARVRAETMGPAGWLKCPLQSTNKRFLLNTLRSTGAQQRSSDARPEHSSKTSQLRSRTYDRSPDRSRSPHRDGRSGSGGGHKGHKKHHRDSRDSKDEREDGDGDKERRHRHGDSGDKRLRKDERTEREKTP